jgi:hypothetical protein
MVTHVPEVKPTIHESEIRRLGNAASMLQAAILQNERDDKAALDRDWSFVYFSDASLAIWYCRPFESQNLSGFEVQNQQPSSQLPVSILTLDYIFSGALPGCNGRPLLLSTHHYGEFTDFAKAFTAPSLAQPLVIQSPSESEMRAQHERLSSAVKQLASQVPGAVNEVFDVVAEVLNEPVTSRGFSEQRYKELLDHHLIRPAQSYAALFAHHSLIDVFEDEDDLNNVNNWISIISKYRTGDHKTAIENDARTLASLQQYNEQARMMGEKRKFVLVTTDVSLQFAMEEFLNKDGSHHSFIRHPRQYMPLLNLNAAVRIARFKPAMFSRLRQAIGDVASVFERVGAVDPVTPSRAEVALLQDRGAYRGPQASELRTEWNSAMQTAALLNIESLLDSTLQSLALAVRTISSELSDPEVAQALRESMELEAKQMLRRNREFAISGILQGLVRRRRARSIRGRASVSHLRIPVLFSVPLQPELKAFALERSGREMLDIEQALDWLISEGGGVDSPLLEAFEALLVSMNDAEAYALATALAFRTTAWRSTRHFASSCEEALERKTMQLEPNNVDEIVRREVNYCQRVAERFLIDGLESFQALRQSWERAIRFERDPFARARASSEMAASILVYILRRTSGKMVTADAYGLQLLTDAKRYLGMAMIALRAIPLSFPSERRRLLEEQIFTNQAATYVMRASLFGENALVALDPSALDALSLIQTVIQRTTVGGNRPHFMVRLYEAALRVILADADQVQEQKARLIEILRKVDDDGNVSGQIDSETLRWLGSLVNIGQPPMTLKTG